MFTPSAAQQAFFDWINNSTGSAILEAVAGAGKTTTILEGIDRMQGRVWLGVYNKKMGEELKAKIAAHSRLRFRDGLYTSTFHSAGFSALRFAFKGIDVCDKKVQKIAKAIVANGRADLAHLIGPVCDCVSMAKNRGIGAACSIADDRAWTTMIENYDLDASLPEGASLSQLIKMSQVVLKRSNEDVSTADFDDMVYLPIQRNLRMLTHEWVLVDEAQDTNPMRRAMAHKLLAREGRLVAVGDRFQSIFGFSGADNDSLDTIAAEFKAVRLPLTVSYRCPVAIVEHARHVVNHIEAHEGAPKGNVGTASYEEMFRLARPGDAVLCRFNKYLVDACFKFIRAGVAARIEGRSIGEGLLKLASRFKVKTLDALERKVDEYRAREVRRLEAADKGEKADRVVDQCDTLQALISRAMERSMQSVDDLRAMIDEMFADESKDCVVLCSVHKSKGLEWNTVFLLGRNELMPSCRARTEDQVAQEDNLIYVAITRAKRELVEVSLDEERKKAAA
jgi:DNA helicase II / ATP-dependent DNA helicase PcrA